MIDKIIDDLHDVNIVINAVNAHGKSSSLKTIISRLKEREPKAMIKIFDISQAWYHNAPVKYRQRITWETILKSGFLNIHDCVYEIGNLTKDQRRIFIMIIVNQDYQARYNMGLQYGIDAVKKLPRVYYVFEEATNYFGSWSLKKNDAVAPILYDFITVGRNYGLRSILAVTREIGSLSTDIRDISPKILGHIEAKSDLSFYKSKSKELFNTISTMPKYYWIYCYRSISEPFHIPDLVENTPEDYKITKSYPWKDLPTGKVERAESRRPTIDKPKDDYSIVKWILFFTLLILAWVIFT